MPYRSIIKSDTKPSPKSGLILAPKPHKCNPPGFFRHLFNWLCFKPIHIGSVYYCKCGEVYEYTNYIDLPFGFWRSVERWTVMDNE